MNKTLPDKWIRKAVFESINAMLVNGEAIPCFDTKITQDGNGDTPTRYVLMTTQTSDVDKHSKCGWLWNSSILLDFYDIYPAHGNQGSRVFIDDMVDTARDLLQNLSLDPIDLTIQSTTMNFPADLVTDLPEEIVYRKFIRIELRIS